LDFNLVSDIAIKSSETLHIEVPIMCLFLSRLRSVIRGGAGGDKPP